MKYEYKVVKFDVTGWIGRKLDEVDMEEKLNQLGSEGWQILKISEILRDAGCTSMLVATMSRVIQ